MPEPLFLCDSLNIYLHHQLKITWSVVARYFLSFVDLILSEYLSPGHIPVIFRIVVQASMSVPWSLWKNITVVKMVSYAILQKMYIYYYDPNLFFSPRLFPSTVVQKCLGRFPRNIKRIDSVLSVFHVIGNTLSMSPPGTKEGSNILKCLLHDNYS